MTNNEYVIHVYLSSLVPNDKYWLNVLNETGSLNFLEYLRRRATDRGLQLNKDELVWDQNSFRADPSKPLPSFFQSEQEIFQILNMEFVPSNRRRSM